MLTEVLPNLKELKQLNIISKFMQAQVFGAEISKLQEDFLTSISKLESLTKLTISLFSDN